jgi:hypothetical protein
MDEIHEGDHLTPATDHPRDPVSILASVVHLHVDGHLVCVSCQVVIRALHVPVIDRDGPDRPSGAACGWLAHHQREGLARHDGGDESGESAVGEGQIEGLAHLVRLQVRLLHQNLHIS